jgi:hypothetical protein
MAKKKAAVKNTPGKKAVKGRPPVDAQELILKLYYEAPKALTVKDLSAFLGICESKFYELNAENAEFMEAVKHYRRISPIEVLNSFKKIAVGYEFDEVTQELKKNAKSKKMEMIVTKVVKKNIAPNATAAFHYLKNQLPEEFKDKVEIETNFPGMESITFTAKRRDNGQV